MTVTPTPDPDADGNLDSALAPWRGRYAFVDVETTGCDPARDRIIEIAIITLEDGRIVDEWSTLVYPEVAVPDTVRALTGISFDELIHGRPLTAVAEEVFERLRGRTLVAHNARFDYAFLRNSLRRVGIAYRAPRVCTLALARTLYPQLRRHGLDALTEHFGIGVDRRHRAVDDIRATLALVARFARERGVEAVAAALERQLGGPALSRHLPGMSDDEPPPVPGIYFLYDAADTLLYIGKSTNIDERLRQHLTSGHRRSAELAQRTSRVDWQETVGELGALLQEAERVKALRPAYNRRLRPSTRQVVISLYEDEAGFLRPDVVPAQSPASWPGEHWYGPFGDRRGARRLLQRLADEHGLCARRLGLESGRGRRPCFARQLGRCRGACTGAEPPVHHNLRLLEALGRHRIRPWPWDVPIGVVEHDPVREREAVHVADRWRYLGTAEDPSELAGLCERSAEAPFDRDHYRILVRWLDRYPATIRVLNP